MWSSAGCTWPVLKTPSVSTVTTWTYWTQTHIKEQQRIRAAWLSGSCVCQRSTDGDKKLKSSKWTPANTPSWLNDSVDPDAAAATVWAYTELHNYYMFFFWSKGKVQQQDSFLVWTYVSKTTMFKWPNVVWIINNCVNIQSTNACVGPKSSLRSGLHWAQESLRDNRRQTINFCFLFYNMTWNKSVHFQHKITIYITVLLPMKSLLGSFYNNQMWSASII